MSDTKAVPGTSVVPTSFVSPSGKRREPRVSLPLIVEIQGCDIEAADWSIGGLSLSQPMDRMRPGDTVQLCLRFGGADSDIRLRDIKAVVVRAGPDHPAALSFVGLQPGHRHLLERIVADHLAGQLSSFEDLLTRGPRRALATGATARVKPAYRVWLAGGGLALTVAVLGLVVYRAVFTIRSAYGGVVAPLVTVVAPVAGTITMEPPTSGQSYAAGSALFNIRPIAQNDADRLLGQRTDLLARRSMLEQQLAESSQVISAMRSSYRTQRVATVKRVGSLQNQIQDKSAMVAKMSLMLAYVPMIQFDQQRAELAQLERQLADAQAERDNLDAQIRLAGTGVLSSTVNDTSQTPGRLREELGGTDRSLAAVDTALAGLQRRQIVGSPCDCQLQALLLADGALAQAAQPVLRLRRTGEQPIVRALIPARSANRLSPGLAADVQLSDGREIAGTITRISYRATDEWSGVPLGRDVLFTMAAVEVKLSSALADTADGTVAEVLFHLKPALRWP
ncbi:MAG: hypothetical protein JWQ90_5090 [Hydrocarboniphaga sp.]|uniref:HlyD family efflux transporter periplasmic adaptor subunit n=1 Tax=Hydrocarboniphaga sp. TaxID=2033016 RepID=UPI0026050D37|nr:HlyD family efflux transporter periplasmic adaptor subunit [Hydrocarboniphaga sp.]MDB5972640.1 hypothetical protein [Hydrocarboniphaga sp.]